MKVALSVAAALVALAPAVAAACPASMASAECASCGGSSLFQYVASLALGVGLGIASVAFKKSA